MAPVEFAFRAILPSKEFWLHSQVSLSQSAFDAATGFLELVSIKTVREKWKSVVLADNRPDRVGYLQKQSVEADKKNAKKLRRNTEMTVALAQPNGTAGIIPSTSGTSLSDEKNKSHRLSKRWFVLKDIFLAYFKSREDLVPAAVIPLDYYIVKLSEESKKTERAIYLDRSVRSFGTKTGYECYILTTDGDNENELRLWFQSTNGRCANTALNRVFGMPLLHVLCHNQSGYVRNPQLPPDTPLFVQPPFLTQCVKYLEDHWLDTEGLFRISAVSQELMTYREYFDTGVEVDLAGTSPHNVACLIKAWIRELAEPLIPFNLYSFFLTAVLDTKDKELKTERVLAAAEQIPPYNLRTLVYIFRLLHKIAQHEAVNKMGLLGLSLLLGPNILRLSEETTEPRNPLVTVRDTPLINEVVGILLENLHRLEQIERYAGLLSVDPKSKRLSQSQEQLSSALAWSQPPSRGATTPKTPKPVLDLSSLIGNTRMAQRKGSNGVIRSLDEELPPLKIGQITISTPSGMTPTVTIETASGKSERPTHKRNESWQWKPVQAGNARLISGASSPSLTSNSLAQRDDGSEESVEEFRRSSVDQHHHYHQHDSRVSPMVSPRLVYQSPESLAPMANGGNPFPSPMETKLFQLIHTLQRSNDNMNARVNALETQLAKEVDYRQKLESRIDDLSERQQRERSPRRFEGGRESFSM